MKNLMTRNIVILLGILSTAPSFATSDSPVVQGLGGAGRGGIPREALFSNPAAVSLLQDSFGYLHYTKPGVPLFNSGGRGFSIGAYDGTNEAIKGAFGYTRISRAREESGRQVFEDRSDYRFAVGNRVWGNFTLGVQGRYVTKRTGIQEDKFFQGDIGSIFPIYSDLRGGIIYEDVLHKTGERPPSLGAGLQYPIGYGITLFADGYRFMKGAKKGEKGWALAAEATIAGGLFLRGGKFHEGYRERNGWSAGLGWLGPRLALDLSMRTSGTTIKERDYTLGGTLTF